MSVSAFCRSSGLRGILLTAVISVVLTAVPARASAAGHVALNSDTDTCAACHRSHSSGSSSWFGTESSTSATQNALVVGDATSDKDLCYTCHGAASEGSLHDVQSEFDRPSHHALAPSTSAFGPSPKQCSDCHDSHGTDKAAGGGSYPALLRSRTSTNSVVFSGEAYCATCHTARPASRFSSLGVFAQTAHYSSITTPGTGTGIRCSVCHAPHGSNNTALVTEQLTPPAVQATVPVPANDRRFCLGCHSEQSGTYQGGAAYAGSAHGSSTMTVPVSAEYAATGTTRRVGECQVCHDPMGRDDGTGKPIQRLLDAAEPTLCYRCHRASGPASTDMLGASYAPTSTPLGDLVAAYGPPVMPSAYSRVAVYAQEASSAAPRPLIGPLEYQTGVAAGSIAAGDVDGDGRTEIVVTEPGAARLRVLKQDGSRGLAAGGSYAIDASASAIAIANIFPGADTQRPVIAVATGATGGKLYLYRMGDSGTLVQLGGAIDIGDGPFSIASGDVRGDAAPEFVVSAHGSDQIVVVGDSGTPDVPSLAGPFGTSAGPVSVSVGDIWAGQSRSQISVAADGDGGTLSIMTGDGTILGTYSAGGVAGATVRDCAVGDVLPASSGNEVSVALGGPDAGGILAFPADPSGGLLAPHAYAVTAHYAPGRLAVGDVDGDGKAELIVGNAGQSASAATPCSPSVQVFHATSDGADLAVPRTFVGGGTELAGSAPDVLVAALPSVGPSRHPVDQPSAGAHVSTEAGTFARHSTCSDCHDSHQSTDASPAPPAVTGPLTGAQGVTVTNSGSNVALTGPVQARNEYEVCLKCHSAFSGPLDGRADVALDFNTNNASFHGVEAAPSGSTAAAASFVPRPGGQPSWTNQSILRCSDCHGDADPGAPAGPHISSAAPILKAPYLGTSPESSTGVCYRCHQYDVYYSGEAESSGWVSDFYSSSPTPVGLHAQHMRTYGLGCASCHVSHGSRTQPHLIRDDIGYAATAGGGSCTNSCHPGSGLEAYSR